MSELVNESSHTYDFGNIDDMDPSLGNTYIIIHITTIITSDTTTTTTTTTTTIITTTTITNINININTITNSS